ncbi:unnamed protein product [Didymodactylos carnosus]|uniref:Uncharacterized protein n=1 Tax=Didymodactylos carnosus TaxID=1234261 RepID=A0A815SK02_9BILA|nr:unnamed protein product [Didymodactylos carnosus]CAF4355362.1 unnamed protein product [Didymodactylos carnosus]
MPRSEIPNFERVRHVVSYSFFSAIAFNSRLEALFHYGIWSKPDDELQNVLFEIEIDSRLKSRSYANLSYFEFHVLFMIGTQFKVISVSYESENVWIVSLKLMHDDDDDNTMRDHIDIESPSERKMLKNCVSALSYRICMAPLEQITIIFSELINLFPSEMWLSAAEIHCYGLYQERVEENYAAAISTYYKVIEIWLEYEKDDELKTLIDIGKTYSDIGRCYMMMDDQSAANKNFDLSVKTYTSALEKTATNYDQMKVNEKIVEIYKHKIKINNDVNENSSYVSLALKCEAQHLEYMLKYYTSYNLKIGE